MHGGGQDVAWRGHRQHQLSVTSLTTSYSISHQRQTDLACGPDIMEFTMKRFGEPLLIKRNRVPPGLPAVTAGRGRIERTPKPQPTNLQRSISSGLSGSSSTGRIKTRQLPVRTAADCQLRRAVRCTYLRHPSRGDNVGSLVLDIATPTGILRTPAGFRRCFVASAFENLCFARNGYVHE